MVRRKTKYILIVILLVCFSLVIFSKKEENSNEYLISLIGRDWKEETKIFHQPNGPFAVMIFDDQYPVAGVIYYDLIGSPMEEAWKINERFWQDKEWASDVSSLLWHPNGKYLYITTDNVYGTGELYKLNLLKKEYKKMPIDQKLVVNNSPYYPNSIYITAFYPETSEIELCLEYYIGKGSTPQKIIKKKLKIE